MDWVDLVRTVVPRPLRFALQRLVPTGDVKRRYFERRNPLSSVMASDDAGLDGQFRLGIVWNRAQFHTNYVAACRELGVPFRVIDLYAGDWLRRTRESGCDAFVAWPDATSTPAAKVIKDRLDVLEHHLGLRVAPGSAERWMYEDKVRLADWLRVHDVPHPTTWVFFERSEAAAFAASCPLPIVTKTAFGAAATGVRILRTRRAVHAAVARAFGRGVVAGGADLRDRQWGHVLFQRYVDVQLEWRLVRVGDAYFGHPKGRRGEFHSGSGAVRWDIPTDRHLDLLHAVTEAGGFRSMAVDAFETEDGELLVNELQTVFGAGTSVDQMRIGGEPGRMTRSAAGWRFEAGDFARNACANLRVQDVLDRWAT